MSRLFDVANVVDTDDWYTPAWIFDGLGLMFDLDVAAPDTPTSVPCRRWLTVADDGLLQPWEGLVWCNPPYSAPAEWCRRWAAHPTGCILLRSDLSTSGPFLAFSAADAIYVPPKRLQFVSGSGVSRDGVNFSSVLLGRGEVATLSLFRLAQMFNGTTRRLVAA